MSESKPLTHCPRCHLNEGHFDKSTGQFRCRFCNTSNWWTRLGKIPILPEPQWVSDGRNR